MNDLYKKYGRMGFTLKDLIEKEKNFVAPSIDGTKENLLKLQEIVNVFVDMINDKNSKPFSSKYTKLLENNPYSEVFKNALIVTTYERVKDIIKNNKDKFTTDFKVCAAEHSVVVYASFKGKSLNVIDLNILYKNPELTSIVYSKEDINEEKEKNDEFILVLGKEKEDLNNRLVIENAKLDELLLDNHNLIPTISKLDYDILGHPVEVKISKVEVQQQVVRGIEKELSKNEDEIIVASNKRKEIINLLKDLEGINFDDFKLLNKLLEKSLGIRATKKNYVPVIRTGQKCISYDEYEIGPSGYTLKYVKKVMNPRKGAH